MARKGQFKKGGGRHGSSTAMTHRPRARTIVKTRTKYVTRHPKRKAHRRRRRSHGGGAAGVTVTKVALTALALGAVAGDNSTIAPAAVKEFLAKVPGQKTFGGPAILGMGLGAIGHFTSFGGRFRPWMRAAGLVGIVLAGLKVGSENTSFKFVGDDEDDLMDVEMED
jgi:hypothetical protein